MRIDEYKRLDAVEIASLVRSRQIDPIEVTEAALTVVQETNPVLNAVVLLDPERARKEAARVDRTAPLAGVPFLVKDNNQFVANWPTTYSSRFYEGVAPQPDSEFIARLRRAGAVLIGKTNTPEFAADWTTEPTFRGPTRNPWNTQHSAGGSSGGAAAAVASGMVPAAHGNDNGGSIRVPAAVCGLFGLKPTRGLVPIGPWFGELAAGLNSEHVLTRTVRDSAAFLDVLAGPEPGGRYQVRKVVDSYVDELAKALPPLRIGLADRAPGGAKIDPEIEAAVRNVAQLLEGAGHNVGAIRLEDDAELMAEAEKVWFTEIAMLVRARERELGRKPGLGEIEAMTAYAVRLAADLDAVDYLDALQRVHHGACRFLSSTDRFDLLVTPTTGRFPPLIGELDSRTDAFDYAVWSRKSADFAPFTALFNVTGQPAASVPAGVSSQGLPIGVQLIGRPGRDDIVLRVASLIEVTASAGLSSDTLCRSK